MIGLVIVYNNQVFSAARRDGARTRYGNRRQAKIDGCTAADVHLHLLRVFVEWLRATDRVTPRGNIIRATGDAAETVTAVRRRRRILRRAANRANADTNRNIGDRLLGAGIGDNTAYRRRTGSQANTRQMLRASRQIIGIAKGCGGNIMIEVNRLRRMHGNSARDKDDRQNN